MIQNALLTKSFFAMGCPCAISLAGAEAQEAIDAAVAEIGRLERAYSRYRPGSITSAINEAARRGASIDVDDETAELLDRAFRLYRRSDRLFDITSGLLRRVWNEATLAPPEASAVARLLERIGLDKLEWKRPTLAFSQREMEVDFGGLVKEYAADQAAALCRSRGSVRGIIDLGGDLSIFGANPDGSPWRVGIAEPADPSRAAATLFVAGDCGIATSGDYRRFWNFNGRRYGHILNPMTGWPVEGLASVTVVAETCAEAGALSTVAMLKGKDGIDWLSRHAGPHVYIDRAGRLGGSAIPTAAANRDDA